MSKAATKKKEGTKGTVSQFLRSTDDEIKAELQAMMNLEYNLHSDFGTNESPVENPIFLVRKTRSVKPPESSKHEKPYPALAMEKTTKIDKFETENQIQTYVPNASIEELHGIVCQAAATTEDKYKILDARDRLMRAKQMKTQLSMTTVTRGTCPDMCPEKERLMRESQHQVAAYELLEGPDYRINHETAVKQYSRSSADQEEPLPQDLRPVNSLKMTMSYLLHEIADLCQQSGVNLAEWYHFLWDRTRGIRKDITQQELCCQDSVELVEQCARFHIVCAERLCAEEVSVFDKKINTENLTKCLQTLKYMYHDLRVKGMVCKNEPEFRAYIILLNLNNGNFMWDVQRLPTSIQKSPEVRFAIEVYSSIESNNYAKFFRLVRETSYLNACILLRYFNQVRVKALSIMVKAYCRTTSTAFPLYELIDILGFEDENDAIYLSEQVGLNLSKDELHIMLNRQNFSLPMSSIEQGRALNIVESKRVAMGYTFGQCIAGETMPEKTYKGHRPHDSFDSQGYLKSESLNAEDQNAENIGKESDPYEYMDEDIPEPQKILRTSTGPKKVTSGFEISNEKRKSDVPHIFKMPTTTRNQSNVFQTSIFAKQAASVNSKKSEDVSPFAPDLMLSKSLKHDNEISGGNQALQEAKTLESDWAVAPMKRSQDRAPSIFSKVSQSVSVFAKPYAEPAKSCGKRLERETTSEPASSSFFGKTNLGDIFTATTPSIFATSSSSNQESSKSVKTWPDEPSIFPSEEQSREDTQRVEKSLATPTARERQEAEKKQELERRRLLDLEREKTTRRIDKETGEIYEELQTEIIHDVCSTIVKEEIERLKLYDMLSEKLVDEILDEYIADICEDTLDREIYVQRKLEELSRRMRNRIILKYYKIWRQYSTRKRQQRSALDVTPVWLQRQSVEECAKSLYCKEQDVAIENMRKRFKSSNEEPPLKFLEPIESRIYAGIKENAKALDIETPAKLYWKMAISWPHLESRPVLWRLKNILSQYICPSNYTMQQIIKCYKPNSYETLHICIRQFEGLISDHHLTGTDGLFFIATGSENPKYVVRRLTNAILSRQKLMPIPVIVAILGEADSEPQNIKLNDDLDSLLESGYISEYTIHYEKTVDETIILKLIQNATLWLTVNKSPAVPLEMDYLNKILDTCLTDELWHRILGHSSFNAHLQTALEDVNFVIDLHNEAVTHLVDIVLDPEALMYTDFPPEFKIFLTKEISLPCSYEYFDAAWKKEENREKLERIMNELSLPKWPFDWPINDTMELHKCVARYCQQALVHSNYRFVACNVLSNVLFLLGGANKTSFVQLLLEILKEKISLLEPETRVVYNKNHVKHFRTLPWWFKSSTLTNYNEHARHSQPLIAAPEKTMNIDEFLTIEEDESYVEEIAKNYERIYEQPNPVSTFCQETQKRVTELHKITETLERTLAEQRSRSRILEDKLEAALKEPENISIF